MHDPRIDRLAEVLIRYSLNVQAGQLLRLRGPVSATPLIRALYRETVKAGAHPLLRLSLDGLDEIFFQHANADQLGYVPQVSRDEVEAIDRDMYIIADENTRSLSGVDTAKMAARRAAMSPMSKRLMERTALDQMRWCLTLFPTNALAQEAEMSLNDYADFVFAI